MREIVLDTETTGLNPAEGHRIIEIGAVELINHISSGQNFHVHINPERDVPAEAVAVHGLTADFLKDKPVFRDVVEDFLAFIGEAPLIIHNAAFDVGFLNAELSWEKRAPLLPERVVDTLQLARQKHPMGPNSLDALCRRYGIDNSRREKHGALLDSELLAEVYIELIGGRQTGLFLGGDTVRSVRTARIGSGQSVPQRPRALAPRLSDEEQAAHAAMIESLGPEALWKKLGS